MFLSEKKNDAGNIRQAIMSCIDHTYSQVDRPVIEKYMQELNSFYVHAVADYHQPCLVMLTTWLNEQEGAGISDFIEFLYWMFEHNKIKDGYTHTGKQRYRSRGKPMHLWVKEVKTNKGDDDCFDDSGMHYHVLVCFEAKRSSDRGFIKRILAAATEARIIKPYDLLTHQRRDFLEAIGKAYEPARATGFHKIKDGEAEFHDALDHFQYMAKCETKVYQQNYKGMFGSRRTSFKEWIDKYYPEYATMNGIHKGKPKNVLSRFGNWAERFMSSKSAQVYQ